MIKSYLQNPPKKYRPIPFWSWNERLDTEETKRQIALMDEVGMGGYFLHARGGLETMYMGNEWFSNVDCAVDEGKKRDMDAWAYDENGWPSGFGNGAVNARGVDFWQKYLRIEEGEKTDERTITNQDGFHFYYDVNPFYVDTLDKKVIKVFIDEVYEVYYKRYKGTLPGIFTDEPQISRNGIPWSLILPGEYKKAYGEELLPNLIKLFKPVGDYQLVRFRFWKLVTKLFAESFAGQIYRWCEERGMMLTGHMVLEETLQGQITSNGAVMPNYEYFHIPGMDWLTRRPLVAATPLQVSSVAHQMGKKAVLSETFALCGHNVSFEELRSMFEQQMARGVTLLCTHLQGYSLRGIRKRDYPPALFYQQPWWGHFKQYIDAMSRIGMLLSEGRVEFDTLLLHPQSSAWTLFDGGENQGLKELSDDFSKDISLLEKKHILFHLGDETIMEKYARVEGAKLCIGTQCYQTVVLPRHTVLFERTIQLLEEFKKAGGRVVSAKDVAENTIIDNPNLLFTKRVFDDFDMLYFVNLSDEKQETKIKECCERLSIETGQTEPFCGKISVGAKESIVLFAKKHEEKSRGAGEEQSGIKAKQETLKALPLEGFWQVSKSQENALTLDYCDYYFDSELIEKNGYVLNIQQKACELKRKVEIEMVFRVRVKHLPETIYLVVETPEKFEISINKNKKIEKNICGFYTDISFQKIDISDYLVEGDNEIILKCDFEQSEHVYENIEKAALFESEKNKLTYDMEIESIYLLGDFSVETEGDFTDLDKGAVRYSGGFTVEKRKEEVCLDRLEKQGYPFFAGSLTLEKTFVLEHKNYMLSFEKEGVNAVSVRVNNAYAGTVIWNPTQLDISRFLKAGENKVEITLVNNLRNLLGPHHLKEGESYCVGPFSFYQEPCIWNANPKNLWDDDYCFVKFGLKG